MQPRSNTRPASNVAEQLAALFGRTAGCERASLDSELESIPAQIAELSRRLVALDRRLPTAKRRLDELTQTSSAVLAERAAQELERILKVPGVVAARVEGTAVVAITEPIVVSSRALGSFRIVIALDGEPRVESIDRAGPRSAWDHPHVQDGLPCLGNLRPGVLKLIAELELALAVQVLVEFLRSYEPEIAYTPIEGWPSA